MASSRIGVLGSGDVGQVLGRGLAAAGHEVKLGSRDPGSEKLRRWREDAGDNASTGTFTEAARFAEVGILATIWTGTRNVLDLAGPENLAGKVVVDCTNPLDFSKGMPPRLSLAGNDSAGEQVQRWLPRSRVVKCFNIVGSPHMVNPSFPGEKPTMFIAGDEQAAKAIVSDICVELGWPPALDIGGIEASRYLEAVAMVWISIFALTGSGGHAFALLRK